MQEKEAKIAVFNEKGEKTEVKARSKVNKKKDILKVVDILVLFDDLVLIIRAKDSVWKKDLWGGSCAGLIRDGEKPQDAAQRTLLRELGVKSRANNLGEKYYDFDGVKRFMSVFAVNVKDDVNPNPEDVKEWRWINFEQAKKLVKTEQCMPTFKAAWKILEKSNNV